MSNRGAYEVLVRIWTDRKVVVLADGFDDAEAKAIKEVTALVGGYDPEVLWAMEVENKKDDCK